MNPYEGYPAIEDLGISERVSYLKQSVKMCIDRGLTRDQLLQATEAAIRNEQYELAEGIGMALKEFDQNPQLALAL